MPFATNRGQRIHYSVEGKGPLIVLQHGMLDRADTWKACGYVDALRDGYRVACVDSLGHGQSDKPVDPALYSREQRAGDLVAVINDLGAERAHLLGYSMGGWMATGVAVHHPDRLESLCIAGWDVVDGARTAGAQMEAATGQSLSYETLMANARAMAPELVEWVTPEVEPGLRACWDAIFELDGGSEAITSLRCPVLLWNGREDPYHDPMQTFALEHGLHYLSTSGDHITAVFEHAGAASRGLRDFFDAAVNR